MESYNIRKRFNSYNKRQLTYELVLFAFFVLIGTIARSVLVRWELQPFPNFEIIMVLTFISVIILRSSIAFFVPLLSMLFSDLLIGNPILAGSQINKIVIFTYSGFALVSLFNIINKNRFKNGFNELKIRNIAFAGSLGVAFVLIYDVWTNIGWWYIIYPHNINMLGNVFAAGIPFMMYHLISGVVTFVFIALPVVSYMDKKQNITIPVKASNITKVTVIAITFGLLAISFTGTAIEAPKKGTLWLEESDDTSVKIQILGNGWQIEDNLVSFGDESVFSLLEIFAERNNIALNYTHYEQFDSTLINSINGDENGEDDMYWQYYVNGNIPMIGCDKFKDISNGDYIKWSFESIPY